VIWAFDRSHGFDLLGTPPFDNRQHGVFATRSLRRPNPIGLTVVELLRRENGLLQVRGVDMLDGTPILDIKPYLSSIPSETLRRGWLAEAESQKFDTPRDGSVSLHVTIGLPTIYQNLSHAPHKPLSEPRGIYIKGGHMLAYSTIP
jgi:hypothetical protein